MKYKHVPVMLGEVVEYLEPKKSEIFIDCTLGGGGYTFELAKLVGENGRVLALDLDTLAINNAKKIIKENKLKNVILINDNFKNLQAIVKNNLSEREAAAISGVVFDLGLSTAQLEDPDRGFSFQLDAPLNMAFGQSQMNTNEIRIDTNYDTEVIVNKWSERGLAGFLKDYGEERYANSIAKAIVSRRREGFVKTTLELVDIIGSAVPAVYRRNKRLHFATRTFQALRIVTNRELESLGEALPQALEILRPGGRIVLISYHSLEDRIVKRFFKHEARDCICPKEVPLCQCDHKATLKIITKKIIVPRGDEIKTNPRARSAKLRVAEKL